MLATIMCFFSKVFFYLYICLLSPKEIKMVARNLIIIGENILNKNNNL